MSTAVTVKLKDKTAAENTGPATKWVDIDDIMAKDMLSRNDQNRLLSRGAVKSWTRCMIRDRWKLTGTPIQIDENGTIVDGQHRLNAIVAYYEHCRTNNIIPQPVRFLVVSNLDPEVRLVVDSGRKRSAADALGIRGVTNAPVVAAACRWLIFIKGSGASLKDKISTDHVAEMFEKHPRLEEMASLPGRPMGTLPSLLTAIRYIDNVLIPDNGELAEMFVHAFTKGISQYTDDAAIAWRERCIRDSQYGALNAPTIYAGTVHARNMYLKRTPIRRFQVPENVVFDGLDLGLI